MSNPDFILRRYNPRRRARGAEAAEVEIVDGDTRMLLWMSAGDIKSNIVEFGPHPGLLAARDAYARNIEIEGR